MPKDAMCSLPMRQFAKIYAWNCVTAQAGISNKALQSIKCPLPARKSALVHDKRKVALLRRQRLAVLKTGDATTELSTTGECGKENSLTLTQTLTPIELTQTRLNPPL